MKNFLEHNIITHNLMSFTAFKSLVIFSLILSGPKSYRELQEAFLNHPYLKEKVSVDTLRVYLNSLSHVGCNITRKVVGGITYFSIESHPFELNINPKYAKDLIKLYKAICSSIELTDLMALHDLFKRIEPYVFTKDNKLKQKLQKISPTSGIEREIIETLSDCVKKQVEIKIEYKSPRSGTKLIDIITDKLFVLDSKLYLSGFNKEYGNYARFPVERILKIVEVKSKSESIKIEPITVRYEYTGTLPELLKNEKVLKTTENGKIIEITSKNKFDLLQRILFLSKNCKVISPESFKEELIDILKKMQSQYPDDKSSLCFNLDFIVK